VSIPTLPITAKNLQVIHKFVLMSLFGDRLGGLSAPIENLDLEKFLGMMWCLSLVVSGNPEDLKRNVRDPQVFMFEQHSKTSGTMFFLGPNSELLMHIVIDEQNAVLFLHDKHEKLFSKAVSFFTLYK
jgi:hypothetical protein